MSSNRSKRIALVGVVLLLLAVVIVIAVPPANQYEISLYDTYPSYFWALVAGALLAGLLAIVVSAKRDGDRSWIFGLLIALLVNSMLLLMPFIRGYQMYGDGDALTHLGYVKEIGMSGSLGENIYPPAHLLVLVLEDATGADPMTIAMLVPMVFSGLYFGGMFYLLDHLFDGRDQFLFGLPFAILPIFGRTHLAYRPFALSIMFVPLVVYLFVKSHRSSTPPVRVAFVLALVALLLYHPLTALFIIGVFSLYFVGKHVPRVRRQYATPTNVLSLSAAIFVVWYSNFAGVIQRFYRVYEVLFGLNEGNPPVDVYVQTVNEASPAIIDLLRVATFRYGVEFLLFGLGFAYIGLTLLLWLRKEYAPDTYTLMFALTLLLFGIGGVFFLVWDLIVSPDRPFKIAKIGAVVLVSQLFYFVWNHGESTSRLRRGVSGSTARLLGSRTGFHGILSVVILLLVVLSVFSFYPSPLVSLSTSQVTEMNLEGTAWVTQHETGADALSVFGYNYDRHFEAQYGTGASKPFSVRRIPDHFNYTEHAYLGQSYTSDTYMAITRRGRIIYPEAFPDYSEQWRFTPDDFDRLERDPTTARVYDNSDYTHYLIDGVREN